MVPPLLIIFNRLKLDRRIIACLLACSISIGYLLFPVGFGAIYLFEIILPNFNQNQAAQDYNVFAVSSDIFNAMIIPVMGIIAGMLIAIFIFWKPWEISLLLSHLWPL